MQMESGAGPYKFNPLVGIAAAALIVASLAATAAMLGILPSAQSPPQVPSPHEAATPTQGLAAVHALREEGAGAAQRQLADDSVNSRTSLQDVPAVAGGCANCGVIQAVRAVPVSGQSSGLGAAAGGVSGAVVGSRLGRGNGRTALGVLGAVGGAFAGNAIEKNLRGHTSYRVSVLMEDGTRRTVYSAAPPVFAVGETVRVENGTLSSARS